MKKYKICVYCGASLGNSTLYTQVAQSLAKEIVKQNMALVYGGGNIGLMGVIADEVLRLQGEVIGIIPENLVERELAHQELSKLHIVKDMHQRKALMEKESDAFIALPGGIGTLEELMEMLTWFQLKLHKKPIGILNTNQFYQALLSFLEHTVQEGFLKKELISSLIIEEDPIEIIRNIKKSL
jgi:uncharacterized protein (TIGR00730 family)